jgi:hypothetical protein
LPAIHKTKKTEDDNTNNNRHKHYINLPCYLYCIKRKMDKINTNKIKTIIYYGLKNIDLSKLNKEELIKANEILEYLEICLSVKIQ